MARDATFVLKRNDLIARAYKKIGVVGPGGVSAEQLTDGIEALQLIIREEDESRPGGQHLWTTTEGALLLQAAQGRYNVARSGLASNIERFQTATFRSTAGDDASLKLVTIAQWQGLTNKDSIGDPTHAYFRPEINLTAQELWVWPVPTSVGTSSAVIGSDGLVYVCINGHTSAALNKPTSGADYATHWQLATGLDWVPSATAATWVTATAYTARKLIRYTYQAPLLDFDAPTDSPDMLKAWTRYFVYRLAHDLAPEYGVSLEERQWLRGEFTGAKQELFPSLLAQADNFHNQVKFY